MNADAARVLSPTDADAKLHTLVPPQVRESVARGNVLYEKRAVKTNDGRTLTLDDTPPGKVSMSTPSGISIELDDATGTLTLKAPLEIVLETAQLSLNVGGLSVAPGATPGTGIVDLTVPTALSVQTAAIAMNAAAIVLTTTGTKLTSTIVLDGTPLQVL